MTRSAAISLLALGLWLGAGQGCTFDEAANSARGCDDQCASCYLDYCLLTFQEAAMAAGVGGVSAGSGLAGSGAGAGNPVGGGMPTVCVENGVCYDGPETTRGQGVCRDGVSRCVGAAQEACVGQIVPSAESCNELDDDCDGEVDEDLTLASCAAQGQGACGQGRLVCQSGVELCRPIEPAAETCNGIDDDCDGEVDEDTTLECYPQDVSGCTVSADGSYTCTGSCAAGTQVCTAGVLSACVGAVTPAQEICGGAEATDEDCDGRVDNGCPCAGSETQACYGGPARTAGIGTCRRGTQTCQAGAFGPCVGEVTPVAESCANPGADNNCDGRLDNVPGLGVLCFDFSRLGVCFFGNNACRNGQLVCNTPTPAATETACDNLDEDCDGRVDETFAFNSDEQNCGGCGIRCAAGQECCGGVCRDIDRDLSHCGQCNNACGGSMACCSGACVATGTNTDCRACGDACGSGAGCCGGMCVTLGTAQHCGGCNDACGAGQTCCGGTCVTLGTTQHCGGCNAACGAGQICCGGTCVTPGSMQHCGGCNDACDAGETCCGGSCVALGSMQHCGGCNDACGLAQACCGGACADLASAQHCGACGQPCPEPCSCATGACVDAMGAACL